MIIHQTSLDWSFVLQDSQLFDLSRLCDNGSELSAMSISLSRCGRWDGEITPMFFKELANSRLGSKVGFRTPICR
jgi:hypothetical protein